MASIVAKAVPAVVAAAAAEVEVGAMHCGLSQGPVWQRLFLPCILVKCARMRMYGKEAGEVAAGQPTSLTGTVSAWWATDGAGGVFEALLRGGRRSAQES